MPNWCSNRATITGPAPVIKEITDILNQDDSPLLNWMVPQPRFEGDQDWYNWNQAFETWALADGRVQFNLEYWEPGCGFVGSVGYDGNDVDYTYVECNIDEAEYKRIASEVWGYEEYEEPEPLTEWYKDGVEAKGLEEHGTK